MKISYKWLSTFFNREIPLQELIDILIAIGLEVEDTVLYKNIKSDLSNCLVGKILTMAPHPDADRLKVLSVDVEREQLLQIVCGASNIETEQKIAIALPGTHLYTYQGKSICIEESTIRGVKSEGMACSEAELGVGENTEGILILPSDISVGMKLDAYFDRYQDTILDVSITPNRTDSMSHWGIAKEVVAYVNYHQKKTYQIALPNFNQLMPPTLSPINVVVERPELCARYVGIAVKNITVAPSPLWLQNQLKAIDIRPVNNIVDITNYILHSYGNPVHAYDMDKIVGGKLVVTCPTSPMTMSFLDNKERELTTEDLLIMDGEGNPLCLAGIMGGAHSSITNRTQRVFFEIAHFSSQSIRKSSLRHELRTESARRFEKGTDFSVCLDLMKSLLTLVLEMIPNATIAGNFIDITASNFEKKRIIIPYQLITEISGNFYTREDIRKILLGLEFEILHESKDVFEIVIPYRKSDIETVYDVVEEIMRIDGLNNIPTPEMFTQNIFQLRPNKYYHWKQQSLQTLSMLGLSEILTNPIIDKAHFPHYTKEMIMLANPLSAMHNAMRPQTFFSGLESIAFNQNRKNKNLQFFELGKKYTCDKGKYLEKEVLSIWVCGNRNQPTWHTKVEKTDFYTLKSIVQTLFKKWRLTDYEEEILEATEYLTPSYTYWKNGEKCVQMGYVNPKYTEVLHLENQVLFAEIELLTIYKTLKNEEHKYTELSKFPPVARDLALVVDKNVPFRKIEKAIAELYLDTLQNIVLFDVFENPALGDTKKSFAFTLNFVSREKTFTDTEIEVLMQRIILHLETECRAQIRK